MKGAERNLTKVLLGVTEVVIGNSLQTNVGKWENRVLQRRSPCIKKYIRNHSISLSRIYSYKVMNEPDFVIISGEEDFTDTDSMKTGADSPELVDAVPDKDNLRYIS